MVDRPDSPYPYAPDGRIAVPSDADWLDPMVALAFAAACTSRIRLATGILLLPQHNPLLVAKQAASLDVVSGGRFVLGVGIGWSSEEFAALGTPPYDERGAVTDEYIRAWKTLWTEDRPSMDGKYAKFDNVVFEPKPVSKPHPPIWVGGESGPSLRRVAPRVGVFAGVMWHDYQHVGADEWQRGGAARVSATSAEIPSRISHCFDFRGPSLAVDTACSSSRAGLRWRFKTARAQATAAGDADRAGRKCERPGTAAGSCRDPG